MVGVIWLSFLMRAKDIFMFDLWDNNKPTTKQEDIITILGAILVIIIVSYLFSLIPWSYQTTPY